MKSPPAWKEFMFKRLMKFDYFSEVQENLWSCDRCQAVLEALNSVLYVKHKFHGNKADYYNQGNSFIDKVRGKLSMSFSLLFTP